MQIDYCKRALVLVEVASVFSSAADKYPQCRLLYKTRYARGPVSPVSSPGHDGGNLLPDGSIVIYCDCIQALFHEKLLKFYFNHLFHLSVAGQSCFCGGKSYCKYFVLTRKLFSKYTPTTNSAFHNLFLILIYIYIFVYSILPSSEQELCGARHTTF